MFVFQAIYNVLVAALFCLLAWAGYYVLLVVLEPFLVPLFWAVLTGFVIHPYKASFTTFLRDWIEKLKLDNRTVIFASCTDALQAADWCFETIGSKILTKWKLMISLAIALPVYHYVTFYPLDVTTPVIILKIWDAFELIEFITWPLVISALITYLTSLTFLWSENRHFLFQIFGCLIWSLVGLRLINLIWPPLWMLGACFLGFYNLSKLSRLDNDGTDETDDNKAKSKRMKFRDACHCFLCTRKSILNRLPF